MAGELYINGNLVDINEAAPFPLTFNIADIKDLKARKGNKSKTIKLPGTRRNKELMLSVFTLNTTANISEDESQFIDFDPTAKSTAQYYQNGLLEFNGVAQLMSCTLVGGIWSFDINLTSDTIDFISSLTKIKINELDWSEYDHLMTYTNQQNSWSGIIEVDGSPGSNFDSVGWTGEGYYYGLIDYGYTRPAPDSFRTYNIPPQVFVYDILKKSFTAAGISFDSLFFESQLFKRLLLAYAGGNVLEIDATASANESAFMDHDNFTSGLLNGLIVRTIAVENTNVSTINTRYPFIFSSQNRIIGTVTADPLNQITLANQGFLGGQSTIFTAATKGLFQIRYSGQHIVNLDLSNTNIFINQNVNVSIFKNNTFLRSELLYLYIVSNVNGPVPSQTFTFNFTTDVNLLVNDTISVAISLPAGTGQCDTVAFAIPPPQPILKIATNNVTFDVVKAEQTLTAGGLITLNAFLPDLTADKFLKSLITAFNLYVKPNIDDPSILEIEPLNDFYNPSGDALDWSSKVDRSKEILVEPTINFTSKNYMFNFAEDNDYWNEVYREDYDEQYGSFLLQSQSQYNVGNTDFKLDFSQKVLATIPDTSPGTFTDLTVPRFFQVKVEEDNSSKIEIKKGKPFIVQLGPMTTGTWTHIDEASVGHVESSYPYVGHIDSLTSPSFDFNFGVPDEVYYNATSYTANNLYIYHKTFIQELVSKFGKQLTCHIMLRPEDISSLNFRKLINIDASVYRLSKISDYQSGKYTSTKVELIRIIDGEGIQSFVPSVTDERITEDGSVRITENNQMRFIE
jgi:hypothetical protein